MKRILACVMCIVLMFCTSIPSSAAVQTADTPSRGTLSINSSEAIDYDAYVKNEVLPAYGELNTKDIKQQINMKSYNNNSGKLQSTVKRDGLLGYDVIDMNGDGQKDLITYHISSWWGSNNLFCDYYTVNTKGELVYSSGFFILEEDVGAINYCVGGIIKANGKNYLMFETYQKASFFSSGEEVTYYIFETDDLGELYLSYIIGQLEGGSSNIRYYLRSFDSYGNYYDELVWHDMNPNGKTKNQGLQSAFSKIGFPKTNRVTGEVFNSLGYKNYTYVNSNTNYSAYNYNNNYPTYFFESCFTKSCYMLNAPTDSLYKTSYGMDHSYEFISKVKHYNLFKAPNPTPQVSVKPKAGTKYGDLDGDDKISSLDSLLALRASVNLETFDSRLILLSDVDKDSKVTSNDALEILRYSVGLGNNKYINKKA